MIPCPVIVAGNNPSRCKILPVIAWVLSSYKALFLANVEYLNMAYVVKKNSWKGIKQWEGRSGRAQDVTSHTMYLTNSKASLSTCYQLKDFY